MADSETDKPELLYVYHVENGKIVLDRALHTDHLRHHHHGNRKFREQWIAVGNQPLSESEKKAYSKQYGMPFDESPRPPLKEWKAPERRPHRPFKLRTPKKA
jgi:hypothetical protein